ncbi:MAG: thiopurine S-methyltransferase [Gammaproteobacteria bacterium]|nr:thiopurine S-methyltransferase [Gammaproteobacteria bacterium]
MDLAFWRTKWARNEIGFHQPTVHPALSAHWPRLKLAAGSRVLVPLCGKSHDLRWLAAAGYEVLGIELSEVAATAFFAEHGLTPTIDRAGPFIRYRTVQTTVLCGDFMQARQAEVGLCTAFYDRAALIALPPLMRQAYVQVLRNLLPPTARGILICVDYEAAVQPPPFIVDATELEALYTPWCDLLPIDRQPADVKGLPAFERIYDLVVRGS